ncbi:MAG: hypothetical protein ACI9W6_000871 [Motiliproteus sp.]|jgi:hypothetical protein
MFDMRCNRDTAKQAARHVLFFVYIQMLILIFMFLTECLGFVLVQAHKEVAWVERGHLGVQDYRSASC